jgi:hypothetical protein
VDNAVLQRLDAMDARCAAATPGPWELRQFGAINGGDVKHGNGKSGTQQIALRPLLLTPAKTCPPRPSSCVCCWPNGRRLIAS